VCNAGKIVTIETVALKLPKKHWRTLNVNPDHTYFPDEYSRHVLYITRIYFRYGETEPELIGAFKTSIIYLFISMLHLAKQRDFLLSWWNAKSFFTACQGSFRGRECNENAVPIVEKLLERMGAELPLLKCLRTHYE